MAQKIRAQKTSQNSIIPFKEGQRGLTTRVLGSFVLILRSRLVASGRPLLQGATSRHQRPTNSMAGPSHGIVRAGLESKIVIPGFYKGAREEWVMGNKVGTNLLEGLHVVTP